MSPVTERGRTPPSLDAVFAVLSERYCRYVLYYFVQRDVDAASVDELEEAVRLIETCLDSAAGLETGELTETLVGESLPKLERTGAVEFDTHSETIRYCREPRLEEYAAHAAYQELGSAAYGRRSD
ncbi:DUF7344 domain-containing protein [Natronorarus salvus]|uniref:DUF7344 domain-containing protein n=1 Tax=Natronorarus salvus TaxID=3117733 RepID=UPI002F2621D7